MQIEHPCQVRFGIFLCCPWPLHSNNKLILLQVKLFPSLFAFGHEILDVWRPLISNMCLLSVLKKHKVLAIKGNSGNVTKVHPHCFQPCMCGLADYLQWHQWTAKEPSNHSGKDRPVQEEVDGSISPSAAGSCLTFFFYKPFRHPYISVKLRVTVGAQNSLFT